MYKSHKITTQYHFLPMPLNVILPAVTFHFYCYIKTEGAVESLMGRDSRTRCLPEAVAGPKAFKELSSVTAAVMSGRRLKAFLVHLSTVSLELVATNCCNLGRNFPLCPQNQKRDEMTHPTFFNMFCAFDKVVDFPITN